MTITLKHTFPIEVILEVDEDGNLRHAQLPVRSSWSALAELLRPQITPELQAEFAAKAQYAVRSRLDDGLVRLATTTFSGLSIRYATFERATKLHFVIDGVKYDRKHGWRAGAKYSNPSVHEEDLAALNKQHPPK